MIRLRIPPNDVTSTEGHREKMEGRLYQYQCRVPPQGREHWHRRYVET